MAREGYIQPGDLLWGPSLPQWTPAGRIQGLALPSPAAPAPPRPAVGAPVPPSAAPAYPPPAPPPAPVPPRIPPPAAPAAPAPAAGFAPSPAAPKRSGRSCLVIGIVLLALALLAGGIAALIWWAPWRDGPASGDDAEAALFPTHDPAPTESTPESSGLVTLGGGRQEIRLSDDSSVVFPHLAADASVQATFARRSNDYPLNIVGLQSTGPMRVLTIESAHQTADPELAPVITIPAADAGQVAPETMQLARLQSGRLTFLALRRDAAGHFVTRDLVWALAAPVASQSRAIPWAPPGTTPRLTAWLTPPNRQGGYLALGLFSPELAAAADSRTAGANVIQYFPVTYQQHINWRRQPQLVRMSPSLRVPERRIPFSRLSKWDQGQELMKPVHNVFVLVHGRNEMEKTGIDTPPQIKDDPWYYAYKRDVWTNLYDVFIKDQKKQERTTVFFEFIYPTFRPIFQGDGPTAEFFHRLIREKLKKQLDLKYPFNLFIIAHSMGGVVSRAGVQHFDGDLDTDFQRLATWGTPHLGSPLVSLNYALISPCYKLGETVVSSDIYTGEVRTVKLGADWRKTLFNSVLITDTPGTQDLRWTLGADDYPSELTLEELKFEYEQAYIEKTFGSMNKAARVVSLRHGTYLYNQNLQLLNKRDKYAGSDRYIFMYGVTNKGVRVNLEADWGDLYRQVSALIRQNEIGFGATAIWALVKDPEKAYRGVPQGSADGAVPVLSMSGHNLAGKVIPLGDCDHEEYFGAPDAPGHFPLRDKALVTARRTLQELGLGSVKKYDPPTIRIQLDRESDLDAILHGEGPSWLAVRGILDWPGDPNVHRRIDPKQVEASAQRRGSKSREPVGVRNLTLRADGEFEAELYVGDIREAGLAAKGQVDIWVRLFFKDDTALDSEPLVLAGRPALLGSYIGTIKTTTINRDYILKRHMLPGSGEYIEMMNKIAARSNEIFLSNLEYAKATQDHKLALSILSVTENSGEAEALEGKYFLDFIYHGAGVVPNGFRPYKDKRNGMITQSYGDREFQVTRVITENENNQTYTYRHVVKGRLDGDTMAGSWSITEDGIQILAGVYTAKRLGGD